MTRRIPQNHFILHSSLTCNGFVAQGYLPFRNAHKQPATTTTFFSDFVIEAYEARWKLEYCNEYFIILVSGYTFNLCSL